MRTDKHIWKTNAGKHILDGNDPAAAVLAYAAGDEVPDEVMAEVKPSAKKAASKPADKAAAKPNDK
jgi:hypothetical protein